MDDFVRVEYRGIVGTLVVGSSVIVESCDCGILRLRAAPIAPLPVAPTSKRGAKVSDEPKDE